MCVFMHVYGPELGSKYFTQIGLRKICANRRRGTHSLHSLHYESSRKCVIDDLLVKERYMET